MRVLIVTHRYPPLGVTGVERVTEQTALSLTALGDDVTILTRRETAAPPFPALERTQRDGIDVWMISGGGPLHGRFPKLAPALEALFERTLIACDPDVVLMSHLTDHSPGYVAVARRWNVPVVLELHDYYFACEQARLQRTSGDLCSGPDGGRACAAHCFPDQQRSVARWALRTHMFRRALDQADALVTPSRFSESYFRQAFGPNIPPLHVLGNGVDRRPLGPRSPARDGTLHVGFVGAVVAHKGVHVLVDALRTARLGKVKLSLFGVTVEPYVSELLRDAEDIEDLEIRAFGSFEPAHLPGLLSDVDVVVVPSIWPETYSIVIREAFASGIPVIASRIGALPEGIRDGENGLLFEPGSTVGLAAILRMLDGDRSRLDALRNGIRETDWITTRERTDALRALLSDVVARRPASSQASSELIELAVLRDSLSTGAPSEG
jgi:glycosyltransferase involved in cell wall biosynthesis